MKLVIIHYHLRPGGVRRIIELATPHLIREFKRAVDCVVLACGEASDREWNSLFERRLSGTPVEFFVEPAFRYFSEQKRSPRSVTRRIRHALNDILSAGAAGDCLVWAHNLGVGRNLLLTRELARACADRNIPLVAHHHDWWFDNRWVRWREMRSSGFGSLRVAAETVFPRQSGVRHVAINQADARILRRHIGRRSAWLPNLADRAPALSAARLRAARRWLNRQLADKAPVWIMPCRLLRRKNVAEALLLTRWLRPEAWLVTTGGVSSPEEQTYANRLATAARKQGWRLRLGILNGDAAGKPFVADLLAASEAVLLTSIQEGFGLPLLEAAAARRPLIARSLPNIVPDLARFGLRFPQSYDELLIGPELFDWQAEFRRQRRLFDTWKRGLPGVCRRWAGSPVLLAAGKKPRAVPFSRLTLSAQLEVLAQPRDRSWAVCATLNPFLRAWRQRAAAGGLQTTRWPRSAATRLSGVAYARHLKQIADAMPKTAPRSGAAMNAQCAFIRERLGKEHLFPLLWPRETS